MTFGNPWGLLALLGIPVVLAIHLFRQRFPEMPVAGTHLWASLTDIKQAGRRLDRLPFSQSLLIEILAIVALATVLSRPKFSPNEKALHLVVVLDDTASMSASQGGKSFRAAAIDIIKERCEASNVRTELTVLLTGPRPAMLAGPSVSFAESQSALNGWRPSAPQHSSVEALELARQLAGDTGQVLLITDTQPELADQVDYVSVGKSIDNIGLTASRFNPRTKDNAESIYVRIRNFSESKKSVTLQVKAITTTEPTASGDGDGTGTKPRVQQLKLTIDAESVESKDIPIPPGCRHVQVSLVSSRDGMEIDNSAALLVPPARTIRYAIAFPVEDVRYVAVVKALSVFDSVQQSDIEDAHLIFGPNTDSIQDRIDGQWYVSIADETRQKAPGIVDVSGPYVMDRRSSLLTGVTLDGVICAGLRATDENLAPLISTGDRIVLGQGTTDTTHWHLNLDLNRSTLIDSPDWPIVLSNFVEQRRELLPGLRRRNFRLGEPIRFINESIEADSSTSKPVRWKLMRAGRNDALTEFSPGRLVEIGSHLIRKPGLFAIVDGETTIEEFAVNFHDAAESRLLDLTPGESVIGPESADLDDVDSPVSWVMLLALGLALVLTIANWQALARD